MSLLEGRGSLSILDFSWNRLGQAGSNCLADVLRTNTKLVRLDISHCGITAVPAVTLARGLAVEEPSAGALRVFRADYNPMGDAGRDAILQAAQRRANLKYSLRTGSTFTDPRQLLASTQVCCLLCFWLWWVGFVRWSHTLLLSRLCLQSLWSNLFLHTH